MGEQLGSPDFPGTIISPPGYHDPRPRYPSHDPRSSCFDCQDWLAHEKKNAAWLATLPACPCELKLRRWTLHPANEWPFESAVTYDRGFREILIPHGWAKDPNPFLSSAHPGATICIRDNVASTSGAGQQCCYDNNYKLITSGLGAGTPDKAHWRPAVRIFPPDLGPHYYEDVVPFRRCNKCDYLEARPPNNGNSCPENERTPCHS